MTSKRRVVPIISGSASTAAAIARACGTELLPDAEIPLVIATNSKAGARLRELPSPPPIHVFSKSAFETDDARGEAILALLRQHGADIIGQYGSLMRTPSCIVAEFPRRIVNQHPCILRPDHLDFGGHLMHGRVPHCARLAFIKMTGENLWTEAVAHLVLDGINYDCGPVIKKETVQIDPDLVAGFPQNNGCKTLQDLVLPAEHRVQIAALRDLCDENVQEIVMEPVVLPHEIGMLEMAKAFALNHNYDS